MINGLFGVCLLWGIGPCAIIHRPRSVSWTLPRLDPILLYRSPGGLWVFNYTRSHQFSWCIVRILRRFHGRGVWCPGLMCLSQRVACAPILGASTVCRSTQPSISTVPPAARWLQSEDRPANFYQPSPESELSDPDGSLLDLSLVTRSQVATFLPQEVLQVDITHSMHPFFVHRLDVGPIRLTSIVHAFNYRIAVLRDGVTDFGGC